jgi:uncharacterized membrane protein YbhN (UPF0104 family)
MVRNAPPSRKLKTVLRSLPVLAALIALPWFIDVGGLGEVLAGVSLLPVALAVLLNFATRTAASERNLTLARAGGLPIGRPQALESLFISNFWSLALPGVSAGAVATVLRYRRYGATAAHALAVLAASRILELIAFSCLAVGGYLWSLRGTVDESQVTSASVFVALAAAGTFLRQLPVSALLTAWAWALVQGVLDAATVVVLGMALGMDIALGQALWINALAYFAILLPLSVAGLGVREAAVVFALAPLGFSREASVALALLMLAMTLVNAALGGLLHARASLWGDRRYFPKE